MRRLTGSMRGSAISLAAFPKDSISGATVGPVTVLFPTSPVVHRGSRSTLSQQYPPSPTAYDNSFSDTSSFNNLRWYHVFCVRYFGTEAQILIGSFFVEGITIRPI